MKSIGWLFLRNIDSSSHPLPRSPTSFLTNFTTVLLSEHPTKPCAWSGSCRNLISRGMVPAPKSNICSNVFVFQSHTFRREPYFPGQKYILVTTPKTRKGFHQYRLDRIDRTAARHFSHCTEKGTKAWGLGWQIYTDLYGIVQLRVYWLEQN